MAPAAETSSPTRPAPVVTWVAASGLISIVAASLGYAAAMVAHVLPPSWSGWICLAVAAAIVGSAGGLAAGRQARASAGLIEGLRTQAELVPELEQQVATRRANLRQIRHDIRGALSPALLATDRLLASPDPVVKRSAEIVVRSVDRAIALLADSPDAAD